MAVPPPMFVGLGGNFIMAWGGFTFLSLFGIYIFPWEHHDSVVPALLIWGAGGAVFGFLDSRRTRREANRLGVPRWQDYR